MLRLRTLLALIVIASAIVSWWLVQEDASTTRTIAKSGPREIDYYVTGLDVTRMTLAGKPANRLRAEKLHHYTDDDTTEL